MACNIRTIMSASLLVVSFAFPGAQRAYTAQDTNRALAGSPYDLINAVNALRATYGLPPYGISPILMYTAQAQADFMAATGTMTHSGPDGIGLTARLLAAGYPLAGDLSAGGFRAENITGGDESMPAEDAVQRWTGDGLHLTTMLSPDLTEIGAGVAINEGRVYYVIDCARPTTVDLPEASTTNDETGSILLTPALAIAAPIVSTPNVNGEVIHEVQPGQSLWQLAIAYNVKVDDIKRLNNLFDNNIYPGSKLLIKTGAATLTPAVTAIATGAMGVDMTTPSTPVSTVSPPTPTITRAAAPNSASLRNGTISAVLIGIIMLALLGGILFTLWGSAKK
jgi:uncharacterized protein YkwD